MNTVTPYPTFTPFPTPNATMAIDVDPLLVAVDSGTLGPQAVQWWQMYIAPSWGLASGVLLVILVLVLFLAFYMALGNS